MSLVHPPDHGTKEQQECDGYGQPLDDQVERGGKESRIQEGECISRVDPNDLGDPDLRCRQCGIGPEMGEVLTAVWPQECVVAQSALTVIAHRLELAFDIGNV